MAFFTKEQLEIERSIGLQLTDYENENESFGHYGEVYEWSKPEFENYLSTKAWTEPVKEHHREMFKGKIKIGECSISYPV